MTPQELFTPPGPLDSLFAATTAEQSALATSGVARAGKHALTASRWHPRINDLDLPEEALATLAGDQV
jgi:hypothetical protein